MAKLRMTGPLRTRLVSFLNLIRIAVETYVRHTLGLKLEPSWNAQIETGIRFWRHQFTKAMRHPDVQQGRILYESLVTETDDIYDVHVESVDEPVGNWFVSQSYSSDIAILYLHGGGYTFSGPVSDRFASMLAYHSGVKLFAPKYRLTPEHPHPAQAEDALAAWQYITKQVLPSRVVLIGDSAGGHMALTLLQTLKLSGLEQPALCIGLCPWTDIGDRGRSLKSNDKYDLVQGWMALQFGKWLDPDHRYGREALSPIYQDYSDLAPIYLQTGAREILHDMILEFAEKQVELGAEVLVDSWPDMPHNFQAYDSLKDSSMEALERIKAVISAFTDRNTDEDPVFPSLKDKTLLRSKNFGPAVSKSRQLL